MNEDATNDERRDGLVAWQWEGYRDAHQSRRNLVIHILTQPLFVVGMITLPLWLAVGPRWYAVGSLAMVVVAVAAQGAGHKGESNPPAPFRSRFDVFARLFTEQFVNFPRFVLSGRFGIAWRNAGKSGR